MTRTDVLVIGCGVIGLTAGVRMREAGLGVRIVTAELPLQTTSSVAAALWYPYKAYPEDRVLSWGSETFEIFEELLTSTRAACACAKGWRSGATGPRPLVGGAVPGVRRCADDALPPGYTDGHAFVAPVIEMPVYLGYLMDRFVESGELSSTAPSLRWRRPGRSTLSSTARGSRARELVGDPSIEPIRGQIVRVRNPGLERFVLDGENPEGVTYVIPRSGDCILGGTAEEGEWDTESDPQIAAAILRRCVALEPRLAEAEVLEHKVGLRPGRPEIRLETEDVSKSPPRTQLRPRRLWRNALMGLRRRDVAARTPGAR